ncbi:hypothetical protein VE03_03495 [Pseudogymnoascus sp. 23342-1-I1]|nr:hypothetical protein VE03_03495 [Pseudogymnoascus sp. 23342-1-I1]
MAFFGLKKFPAPIAAPLWPFYTAGVVVLYGISQAAGAMSQSDEFKNDPRNHFTKKVKAAEKH